MREPERETQPRESIYSGDDPAVPEREPTTVEHYRFRKDGSTWHVGTSVSGRFKPCEPRKVA